MSKENTPSNVCAPNFCAVVSPDLPQYNRLVGICESYGINRYDSRKVHDMLVKLAKDLAMSNER